MNWATYIWITLGAIIAVVESVALLNTMKGDTLSEHVWLWLKVKDKSHKFTAWRFFVGVFLIWLTGHLVFGWWAG